MKSFVLLTAAAFIISCTAAAASSTMERVLLDTPIDGLNPACLDGSPPAYYFRPASSAANASRWVVYFQGGGWCYTLYDCEGRSHGALGSSKGYPAEQGDLGGIISPDPANNPDMHDWNHVWVAYCDGTSYTGNLASPVQSHDVSLHYRGRDNMRAVAHDLVQNRGLNASAATHVLMDGGSAGGLTVLLHADFFSSLLPATVSFGAIGDAGWFRPDQSMDARNYTGSMRTMYVVANSTANAACEAHHASDPATCVFAPITFPFLTAKMFILEGAYDSWQLGNILGFSCATYGGTLDKCSAAQNTTLENYGDAMRKSIRTALRSTPHHAATAGAFVSSCIIHVQSAANEHHVAWNTLQLPDTDNKTQGSGSTAGRTPSMVVADWFLRGKGGIAAGGGAVAIEDCPFPCNPNPTMCQSYTMMGAT